MSDKTPTVVFILLAFAVIAGYDLWAHASGRVWTITAVFREAHQRWPWFPYPVGLGFIGLWWHWFVRDQP